MAQKDCRALSEKLMSGWLASPRECFVNTNAEHIQREVEILLAINLFLPPAHIFQAGARLLLDMMGVGEQFKYSFGFSSLAICDVNSQ